MDTYLGNAISAADYKAQYDEHVKTLLADKQILAWILKYTASEYSDLSIEEIIPCIDEPSISAIPLAPGRTNEAIVGLSQESKVPHEGSLTYDIRFYATIPQMKADTRLRLIVNVEAQKSMYPGYDLVTRGIGYGGRMISEQFGRNVTHSNYDDLEKVYSIWICMNCPFKLANTISSYELHHRAIYGTFQEQFRYDLLRVIQIRLPEELRKENASNKPLPIHDLLLTLISNQLAVSDKKQLLWDRFSVQTTRKAEKEMNEMCNLSDIIEERGISKGISQGISQGIDQEKHDRIADMLKRGKTPEAIFDFCQYPMELILSVKDELMKVETAPV